MDYFGHVNNVSYYKYLKSARVNFWEQVGINKLHKETNIGPMLASCKCDFKLPLFFSGDITLQTKLAFIKNSSFGFKHEIINSDGAIAAIGEDVMVMYYFGKNCTVEIPESIRGKF